MLLAVVCKTFVILQLSKACSHLGGINLTWQNLDLIFQGVGLGVDVIVLGAPSRGENTSRINRLREIEEFIEEDENIR